MFSFGEGVMSRSIGLWDGGGGGDGGCTIPPPQKKKKMPMYLIRKKNISGDIRADSSSIRANWGRIIGTSWHIWT